MFPKPSKQVIMPSMRQRTRVITTWLWCLATLVPGVTCSHLGALSKPEMLQLAGDLRVHDPAMIRQGDTFYVFSTGGEYVEGVALPDHGRIVHAQITCELQHFWFRQSTQMRACHSRDERCQTPKPGCDHPSALSHARHYNLFGGLWKHRDSPPLL